MKIILVILFLLTSTSLAQPDFNGRFEVGGSIRYSYSSSVIYGGTGRSHFASLQPSVGLFVTPELLMTLSPSASFTFQKQDGSVIWFDGIAFPSPGFENETYSLGFSPGAVYHFLIDDKIIPYVGLSSNLSWRRNINRIAISNTPTKWSKPTIAAPILDAGIKVFVSNDWALLVGFIYSRTLQSFGDNNIRANTFAVGSGFSILL